MPAAGGVQRAFGTDAKSLQILDNLVVGIITTQNPDGRDVYRRTNNFDFDLNRDGSVTLVEYRTAKLVNFDRMDSDKDGVVSPAEMKAAPLLRAWLHRLRVQGVQFAMRHRWLGFDADGSQIRKQTSRLGMGREYRGQ